MNHKTLAIVSYITIIGWLIVYFSYKNQREKNSFVTYHLEQSLGVFVFSLIVSVISGILMSAIPTLSIFFSLIPLIPLILLVLGIINALNQVVKPVPVIGGYFEKKFTFLQ
ncbi:import component protein [Chryseobacterium populi]|uniref:import component protein n=1 Tax=Chryseobacterium populi TaxID=1144316 RepID=UPI0002E69884|nr:import component protein [Chryseobacterium populi]